MNDAHRAAPPLAGAERRARAPHPGPTIAETYLVPLGLDARALAPLVGIDESRLGAILAGTQSFDVDAAVRVGRALGLSPERVMKDQIRHDFARSRATENERPAPPVDTLVHRTFAPFVRHGHLARAETAERDAVLFFVDDPIDRPDAARRDDGIARVHAIANGDRLRVYGPDGNPVWAGPVLRDFEGRPLFAFAPRYIWELWFATGSRADYAPAEANART